MIETRINPFLTAYDRLGGSLSGILVKYETAEPTVLDQPRADPANVMRLAGMEPDPWQEDVLRCTHREIMLCCARGSGKSQVTAGLALHLALTKPGSDSLLISKSQDQSDELFLKVRNMYDALGRPVGKANDLLAELHLSNGSRIIPKPCKSESLVGYHVDLLVLDEGARIPDILYESVSPMLLVRKGRLVALSTPCGKRGWFYHEWTWHDEEGNRIAAPDPWKKVMIKADRCLRLTPEQLEREKLKGHLYFAQEFECSFNDAEDATFLQEHIDRAFSGDFDPLVLPGDVPAGASVDGNFEELALPGGLPARVSTSEDFEELDV